MYKTYAINHPEFFQSTSWQSNHALIGLDWQGIRSWVSFHNSLQYTNHASAVESRQQHVSVHPGFFNIFVHHDIMTGQVNQFQFINPHWTETSIIAWFLTTRSPTEVSVGSPTLCNAERWTRVAAVHSMVYPAHMILKNITTCNHQD